MAQIVEFVFAPPAIAAAIGAYFNLFFPAASPAAIAIVAYLLFTALNVWGVKQAAAFELGVTIAAVGELLLFMTVAGSHFAASNLARDGLPHAGVFTARLRRLFAPRRAARRGLHARRSLHLAAGHSRAAGNSPASHN